MRRRRTDDQGGFSLIEALIAFAILSLGLMGLAKLQMQVFKNATHSKTQTAAVNLAQQKLEELRASAYEDIASGGDLPPSRHGDNALFIREWTVEDHGSLDYKVVSVTTGWQTIEQETESVTLTSFIARSVAASLDPIGSSPVDD
jgi:type II secretory pathway component PulJ